MLPGVERALMEMPKIFRDQIVAVKCLAEAVKCLTVEVKDLKPEGYAVALTEEEWVEVVAALEGKTASVDRGDYAGEDESARYVGAVWCKVLRATQNKIQSALEAKGINV